MMGGPTFDLPLNNNQGQFATQPVSDAEQSKVIN
jgi:hypothetical protein